MTIDKIPLGTVFTISVKMLHIEEQCDKHFYFKKLTFSAIGKPTRGGVVSSRDTSSAPWYES